MLNTIKEFLLSDSLSLQISLHSLPVVNIVVRFFQNKCSLDNLGAHSSPTQLQDYSLRKTRFDTSIKSAILIQLVISVSTFALGILMPGSFALACICLAFGMGAVTSYLLDKLMENFGSTVDIVVNDQLVHLGGF
ncbi:MAG: hypothetical protein H0T62_13245 [Parachlamydiaceae bacterium]|nr:hypothetical protein [Parachlamydiaceae bacterium]